MFKTVKNRYVFDVFDVFRGLHVYPVKITRYNALEQFFTSLEYNRCMTTRHGSNLPSAAEGAGVLLLRTQEVFGAEFWGSSFKPVNTTQNALFTLKTTKLF